MVPSAQRGARASGGESLLGKTAQTALLWGLMGAFLFANGCAAFLAGGTASTVKGLQYSYDNIARESFTTDIRTLKTAAVLALEEMAIEGSGPIRTEEGFRIAAVTSRLDIMIDIEPVTDRVSQITVNAKKGYIKKDLATAIEIVRRTGSAIDRVRAPTAVSTIARRTGLIILSPSTQAR
ncbi:MAG: hypothetical protein ACE5JS_16100 [Nitrospinota bacterium]